MSCVGHQSLMLEAGRPAPGQNCHNSGSANIGHAVSRQPFGRSARARYASGDLEASGCYGPPVGAPGESLM